MSEGNVFPIHIGPFGGEEGGGGSLEKITSMARYYHCCLLLLLLSLTAHAIRTIDIS